MTQLLISPAERPPISNLGINSSLPERLGCDILWEGKHGLVGCQRKEVMDLIASVRDSRLGKELQQMKTSLHAAFLIVEGQPAWDAEGNLATQHTRWTMKQHNGVLLSIQSQGVMVLNSRNALETCAVIEHLVQWADKDDKVSSLLSRGNPQSNGWGRQDDRATAIHIWSGLPAVGPERAARIYDAGLRLFKCGVTVEELMSVDGIGKKTAEAIIRSIG